MVGNMKTKTWVIGKGPKTDGQKLVEFCDRMMGHNLKLKPGEPCGHPGCCSHVTHPCEGCGRTMCGL